MTINLPMQLQQVPPRQGALWVRRGFQVFGKQPLAISGLFAAFVFGVFVLSLLPLIGPVLLLAVLPLVSLGFMLASRRVLEGQLPTPKVFIEPLRAGRPRQRALLQLGVVYALCSLAIIWLSDTVDGGALDALMQALGDPKAGTEAVQQQLADPRLEAGLALRFGLATLLSVPFWHAPALTHWGGQGAAQSLFSSTLACWRNKGAFLVFGAVWAGLVLGFALIANLVFGLLGQPQLVALAAMPASLLLSTIFYASLYFSFADCFLTPVSDTPSTPQELP